MSTGQGTQTGGDAQAATMAALGGQQNGQQNGQQTQGNGEGQGQQAQPDAAQGLAEGFLGRIDPAHRTIVEPYVKQWDAGVTRRFQELHGQLQPYQELGDPEMLSQAAQLYEMIDTDPERVVQLIQEALGQGDQQSAGLDTQQAPQGLEQGDQGQTPGLPPEITQQLNTMQQVLEALAQRTLDGDTQQQEQQEDQQLDQYFGLLQQEFGEFDEDFVIAKMMAGMDGEQAVQAYQNAIQGQVNKRGQGAPNVPPILSGGGSVPAETQRISQASNKEVKSLIANILAASQQG